MRGRDAGAGRRHQVDVGARVEAGQVLGLLEAMKMEIGFTAPVAGVVTEIRRDAASAWQPATC